MARPRPRLSLIEVALLLCLLGIVLAIFVPTFLRRVRTNKISEAAELLQVMSPRASAYYDTSWSSLQHHCLPPGAGPTPEAPTVDSQDVDFFSPEATGHATWEALDFQPEHPVRFSYRYVPERDGCGLSAASEPSSVIFRAEGDLDGDGVHSTFERRATVDNDGLTPTDALLVHQRTE